MIKSELLKYLEPCPDDCEIEVSIMPEDLELLDHRYELNYFFHIVDAGEVSDSLFLINATIDEDTIQGGDR
ncbi:hypothetical protein LCGC14_2473000 [marine sediment metagenome]|uniref:Uncharacterized protein n=1 Tax=marine sediment metagenome TaxID=412755 RepID=A0A0F9B9T7_9ZZZZ